MKIEEISTHGKFDLHSEAKQRADKLNGLEGSDNLQYIVKLEDGHHVVALLAGFCDE